jgi:hypothetical protein
MYEFFKKYKRYDITIRLNKNLPQAQTESEFDVLGITQKLLKCIVSISKRIKKIIIISVLTRFPNQFLVSKKFRVKLVK